MTERIGIAAVLFLSMTVLQAQWQVVLGDQLPQWATDVALDNNGDPVVLSHRTNADGTMYKSFIWRLTQDGVVMDSLEIGYPSAVTYMTQLYRQGTDNTMLAVGVLADTFPDLGIAQRTLVIEVNGSSVVGTASGPIFRSAASGPGFIDMDGSLVYGVAYWNSAWTDPFHYHTVRYCPGEGFCGGGPYAMVFPFDPPLSPMHNIARIPDLGIASVSPTKLSACWTSGSAINLFSDSLDLQGCLPIQPIDSFYWELSYHSSRYQDQYGLLPVSSGNILLTGMYNHSPTSTDSEVLVAVEKIAPDGERIVIRDRFHSENSSVQRPALSRPFSAFDEETFAFAFFDNSFHHSPIPEPQYTPRSNVHVLRMDTALSVLGEHIFRGTAIDRWHYLRSIVAAPDGSTYVVGGVYDYTEPSPRPKVWIARIAQEQFVSVSEERLSPFAVFPNPGRDVLWLSLNQLKVGTRIDLHDTQGRLVHSKVVSGQIERIDTSTMQSGLFLVTVADSDGNRWTVRWVKE
jgi:hypothetical protein